MPRKIKPITPETMEQFAMDIIQLLHRNHLFYDINLYVNGKRYASNPPTLDGFISRTTKDVTYYEKREPVDVEKQLVYCNPQTVSITYEGPMYHQINYGTAAILEKLDKKAAAYGLYQEQGYAWSLSFYEG